jgi:bis(5'-nucleosyl)-tetraphosphatase (symmetrical)
LGPAARVVLGNHDLFLLAVAGKVVPLRPKDTIHDVLAAHDRDDLLEWLRRQPLHHREGRYFMVHAGLLPQWTLSEAEQLAHAATEELAGPACSAFLHMLFHESPNWTPSLSGTRRIAAAARVLTRLRTCTRDGAMAEGFSGPPEQAPSGQIPWFQIAGRRSAEATVICGHWAALGLHMADNIFALDSGCVWGRDLTAVRLEDRRVFQVSCAGREPRRG